MQKRFLRRAVLALGLVLMIAALAVVAHQLSEVSWDAVRAALADLSAARIAAALALVALGYAWLVLFDALALDVLRARIAPRRIALAAIGGFALSHNLGFAAFTAGALRLRLYTRWGLRTAQVAKLIAFLVLTYWVALLLRGALVFLFAPPALPLGMRLPMASMHAVGGACAAALLATFVATVKLREPLRWGAHTLRLPGVRVLLYQLLLGSVDWLLAAATFWVLLGPECAHSFAAVAAAWVLAQFAMAATQVPGGLGVLEAVMLFTLRTELPAARVLSALLAFRLLYCIAPLLGACAALSLHEWRARRASRGSAAL